MTTEVYDRAALTDVLLETSLGYSEITEILDLFAAVYEAGLIQGNDDAENGVEFYINPYEKQKEDDL